ncbi:hypothetical protein N7475_009610, partial [Penicillium sp. IBT 31633x]
MSWRISRAENLPSTCKSPAFNCHQPHPPHHGSPIAFGKFTV